VEDRIAMSQRERDVLRVMAPLLKGERTQVEAARLLRRSVRQVRRIQRRLEAEGDRAVVHRLRGRPSNRRCDAAARRQALALYRERYGDFGPTLAAEKLAEDGLTVGVETLRRWLLVEGLWKRRRRRDVHRRRRPRRECLGELVQMDTSLHDWLEGRGESMVLTAMIDDATGKILARFYPGETSEAHLDLLGRWLRRHGRPVALYTDRDSIFRVEGKLDPDQPLQTQFGRALSQLDIELILARSPQAKGRVERLFQTLQDRWVRELRLANVTTIEQANALLDSKLLAAFNRRFTVKPASPNDAHRPLGPHHNLDAILSLQDSRTVANDYTVRFQNVRYQLLPPAWPGLRRGKVILERRANGSLHIRFRQRYLPFKPIDAEAETAGLAGTPPEAAGGPTHPEDSPTQTGRKNAEKPSDALGGSAPQTPRSLSHEGLPADEARANKRRVKKRAKKRSQKGKGRASRETRPSAVKATARRSGRTPALPYPPNGNACGTAPNAWRPSKKHPWRKALNANRTVLTG